MDIVLYTKTGCGRCKALKEFLAKTNLEYTEHDIDNQAVAQELVQDNYILETYCDEESCIVITPIVKIDGQWAADKFFVDEGIDEKLAKEVFQI
jgi:glutaredoxin